MTQTRIHALIALAQRHGSSAQTLPGARQFLRQYIRSIRFRPRGVHPDPRSRSTCRRDYAAGRQQERLRKRSDAIVAEAGYLACIRAFQRQPEALQAKLLPLFGGSIETWAKRRLIKPVGPQVPITKLIVNQNHAVVDGWIVMAMEDVTRDESVYSKAYHRQYGPKVRTENRRVILRRLYQDALQEREIPFDGWRGDWRARALVDSGLVTPNKGQMHIRLNAAYDVTLVRETLGHRVYHRTLGGEWVDVCLVSPLGQTFHGQSIKACFQGLREKTRTVERRKSAVISWEFVRQLGFCRPGVEAFADTFELNMRGRYTPDEIYRLVQASPDAAAPFLPELMTLAQAVGFDVPQVQ